MREFTDEEGTRWEAMAPDAVVAHGRTGSVLAFRRAGDADADAEPLRSNITFNSREAADAAIRTLGEKELRRRLSLARAALGTP
jgi:uncharacterized protein YbaA (DUF1428 family)